MATLALHKFVNLPLTAKVIPPGRWDVVDAIRDLKLHPAVVALILIVMLVSGLTTPIMYITGAISGNATQTTEITNLKQQQTDMRQQIAGLVTQQDVQNLKTTIRALTDLVTQLQSDLRTVPRNADLVVLDRHLSAQDGRMDGIDTRLRDMEQRLSAAQARLDIYDNASRAALQRK